MSFYRKRPLVIEAREFKAPPLGNGIDIAKWCGGRFVGDHSSPPGKPFVVVSTLEGEMVAFPGDWIIRGVVGEFYPVKAEVFEATYEPADGP